MIHLDLADGTSEWLTDDQLKEKYPELYLALRKPASYAEYGGKLRGIRVQQEVTQLEMARLLGISVSAISDIEQGRIEPTQEQVDAYGTLKFAAKNTEAVPK